MIPQWLPSLKSASPLLTSRLVLLALVFTVLSQQSELREDLRRVSLSRFLETLQGTDLSQLHPQGFDPTSSAIWERLGPTFPRKGPIALIDPKGGTIPIVLSRDGVLYPSTVSNAEPQLWSSLSHRTIKKCRIAGKVARVLRYKDNLNDPIAVFVDDRPANGASLLTCPNNYGWALYSNIVSVNDWSEYNPSVTDTIIEEIKFDRKIDNQMDNSALYYYLLQEWKQSSVKIPVIDVSISLSKAIVALSILSFLQSLFSLTELMRYSREDIQETATYLSETLERYSNILEATVVVVCVVATMVIPIVSSTLLLRLNTILSRPESVPVAPIFLYVSITLQVLITLGLAVVLNSRRLYMEACQRRRASRRRRGLEVPRLRRDSPRTLRP